jgi:hypothetical protein
MFKFKQNTAGQKKNVLQITQPASQQKNIRWTKNILRFECRQTNIREAL